MLFRITTRLATSRTLYTLRPHHHHHHHHRLRLLRFRPVSCFAVSQLVSRSNNVLLQSPHWLHQTKQFGRVAYDNRNDDNSDFVSTFTQQQKECTTRDNLKEWKCKLAMLLSNQNEQELVSRERKDRRDFEKLYDMATKMGLYSRQYSTVVVFSKVPLPNYRHDLDDKRPQREVFLPSDLQKDVELLLKRHLDHKTNVKAAFPDSFDPNSSAAPSNRGVPNKPSEPFLKMSVVEDIILYEKSEQLWKRQKDWQESHVGQEMIEFRRNLPSYKERDALLKTISENQVVVISGETGCGKTTQLPQYILESEIEAFRGASCNIICTQPRRISAISVSERVAAERGEELGDSIGYKVRLEGIKGRDTRLLFCTTGILLRRLLVDRDLKDVTHIIVDEIHERGMNEDFLLIVLKDLLPRRPDLRLILMSATLNAELFSSYFGGAPMLHIPGFTYPVQAHFLENILETTGYKLTPYNQIDDYGRDKVWKMQKQTQRKKKSQIASAVEESVQKADFAGYSRSTQDSLLCWNPESISFNLIEHVLCHICNNERPGAILVFMTGWEDINTLKDKLQAHPFLGDPNKVLVLACHSSMASSEQSLIFDRPPDGIRKIVLATNMAETSITINDVVFVVDCGKAKETSYDALNNTTCLLPTWISKAAARQRKGRAGRVQTGECYHLYPRCVYDAFMEYQLPELLRAPLQSLCLQIKSLQLGSIADFLSKSLEAPEPLTVQNAIDYLKTIGALDENENLTDLGHNLSMLPVEPKLGKMLLLGAIFQCLDPILTVVAGLSARDPFLMSSKKELAEASKAQFSARGFSDHLTLVRAYEGWKNAERQYCAVEYCWTNFLSLHTLKAIDSLKEQFFSLLRDTGLVDPDRVICNKWSHNEHLIRAIICAGLFPGVCSVVNKGKSVLLKTMEDGEVLITMNSVNAPEPKIPYPWLVFNEKMKVNAVLLRDTTGVSDSAFLLFGGRISRGEADGQLKMLEGYFEFFMNPALSEIFLSLKRELDELVHIKLRDPRIDIHSFVDLFTAVRMLITEDRCEGRFVYDRQLSSALENNTNAITAHVNKDNGSDKDNSSDNSKNRLQTLFDRATTFSS